MTSAFDDLEEKLDRISEIGRHQITQLHVDIMQALCLLLDHATYDGVGTANVHDIYSRTKNEPLPVYATLNLTANFSLCPWDVISEEICEKAQLFLRAPFAIAHITADSYQEPQKEKQLKKYITKKTPTLKSHTLSFDTKKQNKQEEWLKFPDLDPKNPEEQLLIYFSITNPGDFVVCVRDNYQ